MGNCTKTKFNGVYQNDNLPRYNAVSVKRTKEGTGSSGQIVSFAGTNVTVNSSTGSVWFGNTETSTPVTVSGSNGVNVKGIGDLLYIDKYNTSITALEVNKAGQFGDVEDVKYMTGLTSLQFVENCSGDIANLAGLISLTSLKLFRNDGLFGNIQSLATLKSMDTLVITNSTGVTGTLEEFAASLATDHASGSLSVDVTGSGVTYNGSAVGTAKTITFDGAGGYIIN